MVDLWPDDIKCIGVKAPVVILRQQGALLGRKTHNIVEGKVVSYPSLPGGSLLHIFYLTVSALQDYHCELLRISHSLDLYPLKVTTDSEIYSELRESIKLEKIKAKLKVDGPEMFAIADSEENFMDILRAIFATEKVRRIIGALMAQSGAT